MPFRSSGGGYRSSSSFRSGSSYHTSSYHSSTGTATTYKSSSSFRTGTPTAAYSGWGFRSRPVQGYRSPVVVHTYHAPIVVHSHHHSFWGGGYYGGGCGWGCSSGPVDYGPGQPGSYQSDPVGGLIFGAVILVILAVVIGLFVRQFKR